MAVSPRDLRQFLGAGELVAQAVLERCLRGCLLLGPGGGVGESVTQADRVPQAHGRLPEIVGTFLGWKYQVSSVADAKIANATAAWRYRFHLANGKSSVGLLAWVKPTQSEVWLVATRDSAATEKAISTLTLAS